VTRQRDGFLDALASGRRPRGYRADADDGELIRAAIELGSERHDDAAPSAQFVEDLHQALAAQAQLTARPPRRSISGRGRTVLAAAAATIALIGGTAAVTQTFQTTTPTGQSRAGSSAVLTGRFAATDSSIHGTIVALRGRPAWILLAITAPGMTHDRLTCMLELHDGSIAAMGTIRLDHGVGELDRRISADIGGLRGARLVSTTGQTVAVATFA
jgi:hypothetical protein